VHYLGKSAQFAIAASVALVTVMGVQQYQQSADEYSPLPVLQTTGPVSGTISPVSLNTNNSVQDQREVQRDILRQQQRIKALLVDHQQQLKQNANAVKP
jgi:sigma-E factor negative regulatory protein RseA